jgi:prepilin-type N-terminal cleavage/methylation domain-containing protein
MMKLGGTRAGFTLLELLVVTAILALLMGMLLPSLAAARARAKITKVHAELRGIRVAIEMYRCEYNRQIPPTRFSCSSRTAYDLPVELLGYLPGAKKGEVDIVRMPDPFTPEECYKYRAVGPAIMNEYTIVPDAATLWIPDGFPGEEETTGKYYYDPATSPVRYAVYSLGPDPATAKFDIPGRTPIPRKYWLQGAGDTGVIVHYEDHKGQIHASP